MVVCDLVRLLWSKADVYDGPQHCTLQYGPDLVLLGISDLVRCTPIWSDLVIRVTQLSKLLLAIQQLFFLVLLFCYPSKTQL